MTAATEPKGPHPPLPRSISKGGAPTSDEAFAPLDAALKLRSPPPGPTPTSWKWAPTGLHSHSPHWYLSLADACRPRATNAYLQPGLTYDKAGLSAV